MKQGLMMPSSPPLKFRGYNVVGEKKGMAREHFINNQLYRTVNMQNYCLNLTAAGIPPKSKKIIGPHSFICNNAIVVAFKCTHILITTFQTGLECTINPHCYHSQQVVEWNCG